MKNLIKRSISGLVFLIIMIASMLLGNYFSWGKYLYLLTMSFALVIMMMEFMRMTMGNLYKTSRALAILGGSLMFLVTFLVYGFEAVKGRFTVLAFVPLFVVMINSLFLNDKREFGKFANIYTAILYIAVPWTLLNLVIFDSNFNFDGRNLLSMFIIIWVSDVGAYCFGSTLGQKYGKKLFPSISPRKSWIGFWGGFVTAVAAGIAMHYISWLPASKISIWHCIAISALMNVCGVLGDLIESQWKRHYEVKDSGTIIPGHGGMLDRFDSALMAIPAAVIYMMCFNLI